jgi:hypothetical protein
MSDQKKSRLARSVVFALLAAGLAWALLTHSLVAALVRFEPSYALLIRSDDPTALHVLMDRALEASRRSQTSGEETARFGFRGPADGSTSPPASKGASGGASSDAVEETRRRTEDLRRWAAAILAQEPGHSRALAILGDLKRKAGEDEQAAVLLRASALRSLREPVPHAWLINAAIQQQDWSLAMRHADVLMRMHDQSIKPLTPLVAHVAETRDASSVVKDAVAANPPWRTAVLNELLNAITDAKTPLALLLALKETPTPPTASELRTYLNFLIQRKFFDLAYYTWLQFLTPEELATVGPLFNGGFEARPSGQPFDWVLPTAGTAAVSIAHRPDQPSTRALVVRFGQGRVELNAVSQLLRLRPGPHRVGGEVMGELLGRRGVRWRVACLGEQMRQIGESEMFVGEIKEWRGFSFGIDIPEAGCAAQHLSLILDARTPSERLVSGSIWFDEMSIRRETVSEPPPPEPPAQSQPRQR